MPERKHLFEFGPFRLDPGERLLARGETPIPLTPKAFETLLLLVENSGHLLKKDELLQRVWPDAFVEEVNLAQNISAIRKALNGKGSGEQYIETVPKVGYRFIGQARKVSAEPLPAAPAAQPQPASIYPENVLQPRKQSKSRTGIIAVAAAVLLSAVLFLFWPRIFPAKTSANAAPIRSIAILPLVNLSSDPEQEYFSDGMTDELITDLAKIQSLRVISHTSVERYKKTKLPLPEIARELGVDAIVEGRVVRSSDRVRITAQLIDARSDQHLWAESYERDFRDVLSLQDEVARNIAAEIRINVTPQEQARLTSERKTKPFAYEAYLRGRYLWSQRNAESITKAAGYFQQAISDDPSFALAYSGLSDCYWVGWGAKIDLPRADEYARKAVTLQPDLAEAHASLGITLLNEYQMPGAERELKRAIELNPNYAMAHHFYSAYLLSVGRPADGLHENDRAKLLDPFSIPINTMRMIILVGARSYGQAIEQAEKNAELFPQSTVPHNWMARLYWLQGKAQEAIAEERKAARLKNFPERLHSLDEVAATYEKSGLRAAQLKSAQFMERSYRDHKGNFEAIFIAFQYANIEDKPKVLHWLEESLRVHELNLCLALKSASEFDFLRKDPSFQNFLHRLNLAG